MRRAPLAVLVTVCSFLPLVPSTAAFAADGPTKPLTLLTVDRDGDGSHGVYDTAGDVLVPDTELADVYALAGSRDGSRFAYLQDVYNSDFELTHERLVVRDTTVLGAPAFSRTVSDLTPAAGDVFDLAPSLSPDGTAVVWTRVDDNGDVPTFTTLVAGTSSGTGTAVAQGLFGAAFLDATTLIASTDEGVVTLPATGGAQTPVEGLTAADSDFVVSPDGSRLAWLRDVSDPNADTPASELHVAALALAAGAATLTGDAVLVSDKDLASPSWTADGTAVDLIEFDSTGAGSAFRALVNGSGVNPLASPSGDKGAIANVLAEATAPGSVTLQPFVLAGTSATLRWTLPADADVYGVEITRTAPGMPSKKVRATGTSYTDTGLVLGTTYAYSVAALDKAANTGVAATRSLTAIKPTATFPDPTSTTYYTSPAFRVGLPSSGTYTVQVRTNGTGALTTWLDHKSGASQVFTTARAGYSYGFLVTVFDAFGNSSAPTGVGTAVVPYDQTRASYSGTVVTQSLAGRYLGSATFLKTAGSAARLVVNGNRLQVVGERCASCGVMDVYVDGTRVAGIDTRAAARQARQVLYTRSITAGVNHTITIKARGTAGRPNVVLDAFGVRH